MSGRGALVPGNPSRPSQCLPFLQVIYITLPNDDTKIKMGLGFCLFLIRVSGPRLFASPWGPTQAIWLVWHSETQNRNLPNTRLSHCELRKCLMGQVVTRLPLLIDSTNIYLALPIPRALFQVLIYRENCTKHRFCPRDVKNLIKGEKTHI